MLRLPTLLKWPPSGRGKKHLVGWKAQSCQPLTSSKESVKATPHFRFKVARTSTCRMLSTIAARIWWATEEVPTAIALTAQWCPLDSLLLMITQVQMEINKQETLEWSARAKRQVWSRRTQISNIIVCEAVWVHRISSSRWCLEATPVCYHQPTNSIEIKLTVFKVKT